MAQKKPVELSKHETDVLLGLYSGCECLWNTKNADYNVRAIRHGAFRTIINGMRLETGKVFTIEEVLGSLRSVKSVYQRELQQVLDGDKNSTGKYKPQWRWFHFLDSFLRNHILQKDADPDVCSYDDGNSKQVVGESSDTDENDCAILDSDESSVAPAVRARAQSHVRSSQPPASAVTNYLRSVKNRSFKLNASSVANGIPHRGDGEMAKRQSPRKKQKMTVVSSQDNRNVKVATCPVSRTGSSPAGRANTVTNSANVDRRQAQHVNKQPSTHSVDSLHISSQIAETLKAVQTLLAKTLTDQDQPSMVFARHIAKELELITNYRQRKQCMLDIQQVIIGYQTGQHETVNVKHEKTCMEVEEEEVTRVETGSGSASSSATTMQCGDDSLPLQFDEHTC